jgi:hypothetical protein
MVRIFHITNIENVPLILQRGELCCDRTRVEEGLESKNIGYEDIKLRRRERVVEKGPGGTLWDYVPFFFGPRPPMLLAIHSELVPGHVGGQMMVVHVVSSIEAVVEAGLSVVFTDGHAEIKLSQQFDDLSDLNKVDWDLMNSRYWHDTPTYPDRKRRRQAEFLVHGALPWPLVHEVGVMNEEMRARVFEHLKDASHHPSVVVHEDWYY